MHSLAFHPSLACMIKSSLLMDNMRIRNWTCSHKSYKAYEGDRKRATHLDLTTVER